MTTAAVGPDRLAHVGVEHEECVQFRGVGMREAKARLWLNLGLRRTS